MTLLNATISGNSASNGGGIRNILSGVVTMTNTIVANSVAGGDIVGGASFVFQGMNIVEDSSRTGANILNVDPLLGPLADNGGPTQTLALLAGSQAIDAGDGDLAASLSTDQRGYARVFGAHVDIGAVEAKTPTPIITVPAAYINTATFDISIDFGLAVNGFDPTDGNDLAVGNGSVLSFTDEGSGLFLITINADTDGVVNIDVLAGAAVSVYSGLDNVAGSANLNVDRQAPTPIITGPVSPTNEASFTITINFGEPVTGFDSSDLAVNNGSVASVVNNADGTYTVGIDADMDGLVTVEIDAAAAQDLAGNASLAATPFSVTVDTVAPTSTITGPTGPLNTDTFTVNIDISEIVTDFAEADISVGNGSVVAGTLNTADGQHYTVDIMASADGSVTVELPLGAARDLAGNDSLASTPFGVTVDTTPPTVAFSSVPGPLNDDPFELTIDFGEVVTEVTLEDIVVGNGSVFSFNNDGGGSFTVFIDTTGDGEVTVDIPADASFDLAGNGNVASAIFSIVIDTQAPRPIITGPASPTNADPFTLVIDFGEDVNFTANAIVVGNGSVSSFVSNNPGGSSYTVGIDADADGLVTVALPPGAAQDLAGNDSLAATPFSVVVDATAPAPVISGPATASPNPFSVTIDFGEEVTGFTANVTNGNVTSFQNVGGGLY